MIAGLVARALDASPIVRARRSDTAVSAPPERRVAMLVAGLGSTSGHAAIDDVDVGQLGYDTGRRAALQLRGRAHPDRDGGEAFADIASRPYYDAADSQADLRRSGERLR